MLEARLCTSDELTIITLSPEKEGSRINEFRALGLEVRHVRVRGRHLVLDALALRRVIVELAPRVCHSHGVKADGLLAVASLGLPLARVSTVHNIPFEDLGYTFPGLRGKLAAALAYASLWALRGELVGCSMTVASHLARTVGGRTSAVRNPVEAPAGSSASLPRCQTRLVSAGVITDRKRTRRLVELFRGSTRCLGLGLTVFGHGPLRSELMESCNDPRIAWPGYCLSLGAEFRAAAAYLSAAASEGMPLTPLEALLCGCPCVLSDIPQHREVAELSPSTVFLFDPRSQRSFDDAIEHATSLKRAPSETDLGALARRLSPLAAAAAYTRVYEAAIGITSPRRRDAA